MVGKSRRPVSDDKIISMYEEMRSAKAVADVLGVSDQTVYYVLQKNGIRSFGSSPSRRRTKSDNEIIELYREMKDGNAVARRLKISNVTVYQCLRANQIERTGLQEYRHRVRKFDAAQSQEIIDAYNSGRSALSLSKEHRCSTWAILNILTTAGIAIRRTQAQTKLTPVEQEEIKALYLSGLTMKETGEKTGRMEATVLRTLRLKFPEIIRPKTGPGSPHWRGGRSLHHSGYYYIRLELSDPMYGMADKNGCVAEHRLVLARKIGRPLLKTETVHHINGDRNDNRLENLELRQGKHGKHVVMCCLDCGSKNIGHAKLG